MRGDALLHSGPRDGVSRTADPRGLTLEFSDHGLRRVRIGAAPKGSLLVFKDTASRQNTVGRVVAICTHLVFSADCPRCEADLPQHPISGCHLRPSLHREAQRHGLCADAGIPPGSPPPIGDPVRAYTSGMNGG